MKSPGKAEGGREPVLDGIRGIAILLVLFHHFVIYSGLVGEVGPDRIVRALGQASWIGVDVFFVLSGFLITGILYDTKSSPHFFRTFYGRRTVRIFPLYYGLLFLVFFVWPALFGRRMFSGGGGSGLWYWTYMSNIDVAIRGWQAPLEIGHFWSLAVEEQFYLVWPIAVFTFGRQRLLRITATCFLLAGLLRIVTPTGLRPLSVYVLMPMRMDSLAAGAFLALAVRSSKGWRALGTWPERIFISSSFLLGVIFLWRKGFGELDPVVRTLGYSLIALCCAAFIAIGMSSGPRSALRGVLGSKILVMFGTYSYGLYVFHHVVVLTLRGRGFQTALVPAVWGSELPGLIVFSVVALGLSGLLAYLSWHYWETPFLRLKRYLPYRRSVAGSGPARGGSS